MWSLLKLSRVKFVNASPAFHFLKLKLPSSCPCNYLNVRSMSQLSNPIDGNLLKNDRAFKARTAMNYMTAAVFFIAGCGFAAVPLFNAYCSSVNYAEVAAVDLSREKTKNLKKIANYEMTVSFNADKSAVLRWNFRPLQTDIKVYPGETVLAFYTAENPTDEPISGISTYNVVPYEAGKYFNKIQCFCFDEQRLNPHEKVDMPIFFYIDPDITNDPYLFNVKNITLSYTFFESIDGLDLPFMNLLTDEEK